MPVHQSSARRVVVVGSGFFSQFHIEAWQSLPGIEVIGLCDIEVGKAKILAERFGVPHVFSDLNLLLQTLKPDLVDLVTPPSAQDELLSILYDKGLPVICQKPLGTSFAQAEHFVKTAAAVGMPLIVHENFRFMPWFRELYRLIQLDHFGQLHGISFRLRPGDGQGPRAYLDRQPYFQAMPRLLVAETAIHFIDTFRYLMGEVTAVSARLRRLNPAIKAEDSALISFEFENGSAGVFDGNRLNHHPSTDPRRTMGEMWIEGSKGVMRLDGEGSLWWSPHQGIETEHTYHRGSSLAFGGACAALQAHVLAGLEQAQAFENSAQDYLQNLLIQEAVYASHVSGKRIVIRNFKPPEQSLIPSF
jgi:D-apiose dehydrogenase